MARRRPANQPARRTASEHSTAAEALEARIRSYHALGKKAWDEKGKPWSRRGGGLIVQLAEEAGVHTATVRAARRFASRYTGPQLEELCGLHGPDGLPLGLAHVKVLAQVRDKRRRRALQRRAAKEGWGVKRLRREVQAAAGAKRSKGRSRLRGEDSARDALEQSREFAEDWLRRTGILLGIKGERVEEHVDELMADDSGRARDLVARLLGQLEEVEEAARSAGVELRRLLARAEGRRGGRGGRRAAAEAKP
jgi:hypothetical protein